MAENRPRPSDTGADVPARASDITVLVLGTYHMANPKLDLVTVDIRDTLGADRQQEIAALNARLAEFRPSKIIIEAVPPADESAQAYARYLAGNATLASGEDEQIGFRLAKQFGHKRLYPADSWQGLDFGALMASAEKQNKAAFVSRLQSMLANVAQMMRNLDRENTVSEILAALNCAAGHRMSHSFYMDLLDADGGGEFAGSDVTGSWYQRNLRIFSNIKRLAEPGDRLLVIFGAGHAKLLGDFVRDTRGWALEDPMKYLPEPPELDWAQALGGEARSP